MSVLKTSITGKAVYEVDDVSRQLAGLSSKLAQITGFDPGPDKDKETIKQLVEALKQVLGWIDNWDVQFADDPEWQETRHHVDAILAKVQS